MPFWWLLLKTYQDRGNFALTPSFVLGATRYVEGADVAEPATCDDLEELLWMIGKHADVDHIVRVSRCAGLGLPVLRIVETGSPGVPLVCPSGQPLRLLVLPNIVSATQPTTRDLTVDLWEEFGLPISQGRFSREEGEFRVFGPEDLALIHEVANS